VTENVMNSYTTLLFVAAVVAGIHSGLHRVHDSMNCSKEMGTAEQFLWGTVKTATHQNGDTPKRRQIALTKTATN